MTKKECKCKEWKENIPILESTLIMQIVRGHSDGLNKSFDFCPYCGKKLSETKKEEKQ